MRPEPPFHYRKPKPDSFYAITEETRRLLRGDPGRALVLSQVRHLMKRVRKLCVELHDEFGMLEAFLHRQRLAPKHWRPEAEFLGFVVGRKKLRSGHVMLHHRGEESRVVIEKVE